MVFEHPLLDRADEKLAEHMKIKAYPRGGSANTTNNTGFYDDTFNVRSGASFRMVVDVGNWDDARMTNAPGNQATRVRRSTTTYWKTGPQKAMCLCCFHATKLKKAQCSPFCLHPKSRTLRHSPKT
jgi:penicillin amidase